MNTDDNHLELLEGAERALEKALPAIRHLREVRDLLNECAPWTRGSIKQRVAQLILMTAPARNPEALCTPSATLCLRCMNDISACDKTWKRADELAPQPSELETA